MATFFDWIKELRSWIVLVIILFLLFAIGVVFYNIYMSSKEKDRLLSDKDKEIKELIEKLEHGTTVKIVYAETIVYKDRIIYREKQPSLSSKDLFNRYCDSCKKDGAIPLIIIESDGIRCQANICDPNDNNKKIEITDKGKEEISEVIEDISKPKVLKIMGIAGYEFFNQGIMLGASFLDYKGILLGADIISNFKNLDNSGLGLFIGYRPELGKLNNWKVNVSIGAGAISDFNDFSISPQAFIGFTFLEQDR